jgi:hypothetical protein
MISVFMGTAKNVNPQFPNLEETMNLFVHIRR